jgi:hypothetical protein
MSAEEQSSHEDIILTEQTVGETPQEEKRSDEDESPQERTSDESISKGVSTGATGASDCTTCHCDC